MMFQSAPPTSAPVTALPPRSSGAGQPDVVVQDHLKVPKPAGDGADWATAPRFSWRSSSIVILFDKVYFSDPALEKEFEVAYIKENISASLLRLLICLTLAMIVVIMRLANVFGEFTREADHKGNLYMSIFIQFGFLAVAIAVILTLYLVKQSEAYLQEAMVVVVLLAISAVLITTQIGHNQLMLRWPLNTLLVILGLSSVSIRMRCMQNLIVTVTSDVLFILLLFINQEYTPGSSTTFADFLSSIGVLIVMSFIFVHSSFQNEALRRSEYVHMRRVMQQNKILQDKLEQVEKQKRAPRPDINMDSPLEKILSRLNIVLAACRTESASKPDVVSNLTEVVQLLEANTESLLRPDLHVRDGAAVDSNAVRFMTTEFQRDEFSGAKSRRAGVGRVSSVPSRYGRHASAIRSAPIKENAQEEPGAVGKKPASLDLGVEKNIVAAELSRTLLVWDVDFLDVNERTGGNAILLLSTALFKEHNLISELGIDTGIFERFFTALQQRYLEVPYHNSAHGADVCHSFYNILIKSNQLPVLQPIELMAALIACFGHDVAHPGFNNSYLINTGAPEAILYNDKAVLENMHVAEIFKLASAPEMNIFHSLSRSQYKAVRSIMIDMILSTDLAKHFEIMSGFKIKLQSVQAGGADAAPSGNWCEKDVLMMLRIIVKIGDIAHFAKTNKLHMRWNDLVLEEFYHQGDLEIERGLEVNPLMDRRLRSGVGANQVFFINLIVKPLFEAAQTAFEGFTPVMKELESNLAFWQAYKGDAEESDIARQSTIEDCLAT